MSGRVVVEVDVGGKSDSFDSDSVVGDEFLVKSVGVVEVEDTGSSFVPSGGEVVEVSPVGSIGFRSRGGESGVRGREEREAIHLEKGEGAREAEVGRRERACRTRWLSSVAVVAVRGKEGGERQ